MSAAASIRGSTAALGRKPFLFWIKRDRAEHLRLLQGSVSLSVPGDCQDSVLTNDCEDWCFDNLREGLLAEWRGLELILHFATVHDAILFRLRWL